MSLGQDILVAVLLGNLIQSKNAVGKVGGIIEGTEEVVIEKPKLVQYFNLGAVEQVDAMIRDHFAAIVLQQEGLWCDCTWAVTEFVGTGCAGWGAIT